MQKFTFNTNYVATKNNQQFKLPRTPFTVTYRLAGSTIGDVHANGVVVYRGIRLDQFIEGQRTGKSLAEVEWIHAARSKFEQGQKAHAAGKVERTTPKKLIAEIVEDLGLNTKDVIAAPKKPRKSRARTADAK